MVIPVAAMAAAATRLSQDVNGAASTAVIAEVAMLATLEVVSLRFKSLT